MLELPAPEKSFHDLKKKVFLAFFRRTLKYEDSYLGYTIWVTKKVTAI
jgi:hypothetical protein